MEIRAYPYDYLRLGQRILGDAVDFAVNTVGIDLSEFERMFLNSRVVIQFQNGNCKYIAGVTGCELFRYIAEENGFELPDVDDVMYVDKSREYWCGWALAFYQWHSAMTFAEILKKINLGEISDLYPKYHEVDIMHFVEHIDTYMVEDMKATRLKRLRKYYQLSQSQLSRKSGVPLRQIQLFEQRKRDINKTQAETLYNLSQALNCEMKDLLEG